MNTVVGMSLEVSFRYFYRRVPHGIRYQLLLIVAEIGKGSPTVAGTVTAQRYFLSQQTGKFLQMPVKFPQGMLVLPVLTGTRITDKGEKIRGFRIGALQCLNQLPGFRLYPYCQPGSGLPPPVRQDIPFQIATAQKSDVYKRNSPSFLAFSNPVCSGSGFCRRRKSPASIARFTVTRVPVYTP